jgi:competence protein ComEC
MRSPRPSLAVLIGVAAIVAVALAHSGEIRERAAAGLGRGMPAREAELARGFVLGEDEGIDAGTKEDFRRSGLSHLLAVSGENVTLLALLALPLLGALGIPLRERLLWLLGLIAVYVPLAGSGPSIQRAAVMGAAGLLATLEGRRASRLYALGLALVVTLAVNPGVGTDVGWQLSFAAVVGILLLAGPLRDWLAGRIGRGGWRRALGEGLAVTIAATLATAPLIAFHFEALSTTTLLANVMALPAVAPAMWLGMAGAALSQVPGAPVELLNGLDALLLAYIAQVAAWCAGPSWAEVHVRLGLAGLAAAYVALAALVAGCAWIAHRWRLAGVRARAAAPRSSSGGEASATPFAGEVRPRTAARGWQPIVGKHGRLAAVAVAALALLAAGPSLVGFAARSLGGHGAAGLGFAAELRIEVLDVGQGDAILLQPARAPALLVDGGPPGDDLEAKLAAAGVHRLGAAVISHDESDHAAGVEELLGELPIARLVFGRLGRAPLAAARAAGAAPVQVAAGTEVRSGNLHLEVLWPPAELLARPLGGEDPNDQALVILAHWHDFSMLLTADAEAEAVPIDPGPVDVLKVAHHGSEDSGLGPLLDRIRPRLAVISVGARNSYGHPTAETLATLASHGVPVLRTDEDGTVAIEVGHGSISVHAGG